MIGKNLEDMLRKIKLPDNPESAKKKVEQGKEEVSELMENIKSESLTDTIRLLELSSLRMQYLMELKHDGVKQIDNLKEEKQFEYFSLVNKGDEFYKKGEYAEAIPLYERAKEILNIGSINFHIGTAYSMLGDQDKGLNFLLQVGPDSKDYDVATSNIGTIHLIRKDFRTAIHYLKLRPDVGGTGQIKTAYCHYKLREYEESYNEASLALMFGTEFKDAAIEIKEATEKYVDVEKRW